MIIIMKPNAGEKEIENVVSIVRGKGLDVNLSQGKEVTVIGVIGDKTKLDGSNVEIAPGVDLEKDVLGKMEFKPIISKDLKLMDARIFRDELMGLEI